MSNYKSALKKLEEETKANTTEGMVREHDLKSGLADRIIEKHWNKQDKQWKVEFAKEILKEREATAVDREAMAEEKEKKC